MKTEVRQIDATARELNVEVSGDIVKNKFEDVLKKSTKSLTRHKKKSYRNLALKMIRFLDEEDFARRGDLVEALRADKYQEKEIEFLLKKFHSARLLHVTSGRYADVQIS